MILDTDALISILRGYDDAKYLSERIEDGENFFTTVINAFELFHGALKSTKKEIDVVQVESMLKSFGIYLFNSPASWQAAKILNELENKGETLDFQDIAIASISIVQNEVLITRNLKHFKRIKGLKTEKW